MIIGNRIYVRKKFNMAAYLKKRGYNIDDYVAGFTVPLTPG